MSTLGADLYNLALTGGVAKTLNSAATDSDHIPVVIVRHVRSTGFKAGQSPRGGLGVETECAQTLQSRMSALEPTVLVEIANGRPASSRSIRLKIPTFGVKTCISR